MAAPINFSRTEQDDIIKAYESGIGVGGIPKYVGLNCSESPVKRFLVSKFGKLRNRSEQQAKRMSRMTFEERCANAKAANIAATGRVPAQESLRKRAKTMEGRMCKLSSTEPVIYDFLVKNGFNPMPSKAIDIYNADFAIGSVTVEVFGGGRSISDKARLTKYINRTKKIGDLGFHTVFIVLTNKYLLGDGSELVRAIYELSWLPAGPSQYRVIGGNTEFSAGLSNDIDYSSFVSPFEKLVDVTTGRYYRSL